MFNGAPLREQLSALEERILDSLGDWHPVQVSDLSAAELEALPDEEAARFTVRASFLRALILGGYDLGARADYTGPYIRGAIVDAGLDMCSFTNVRQFSLRNCVVKGAILLDFARTGPIFLDGTIVRGKLSANRATINGSLYLRRNCEIRGDQKFGANLSGADIAGSLSCRGAHFGTREQLSNGVFTALRIVDASIRGTLIFGPRTERDGLANEDETKFFGRVSLRGTRCGVFIDYPGAYEHLDGKENRTVSLDGFVYDRIDGRSPGATGSRLAWLALQPSEHSAADFRPQPYSQLVRVLRAMGYEIAAKDIAIKREDMRRDAHLAHTRREIARRRGIARLNLLWAKWLVLHVHYFLLRFISRYGYSPHRTVGLILLFVLLGTAIFAEAYQRAALVPANAVLTLRAEWLDCRQHAIADDRDLPISVQSLLSLSGLEKSRFERCLEGTDLIEGIGGLPDYPRFSPFWYSVDTFVPLVDLGQETFWVAQGAWPVARYYLYLHIALGWLLVTFGIAGVLGMVNKRASSAGD